MKPDSIIDIRDGQVYKIVKIGQQWWMQENLNIGTMIDGNLDAADNFLIEKYCYDNSDSMCNIYGGLYQWDEALGYDAPDNDITIMRQGICPAGWHLPDSIEWAELAESLGGPEVAGGKMKETGFTHWASPNTAATNESGFTGIPGGYRNSDPLIYGLGNLAYFWSTQEYSDGNKAFGKVLTYNNESLYYTLGDKVHGYSVRCLRDSIRHSYLTVTDTGLETVSHLDFYGDGKSEDLVLINSSGGMTINATSIHTNQTAFKLSRSSSILSPGDSLQLRIVFDPEDKTIYRDTLFIESNDPFMPVIAIPLNGTFPPEISFTDSSNISCFGYSDGSATVTPSFGTPPFKYQWDDPAGTSDSIVSGLDPDILYMVTVTDSLGWTVTDSIILSEPDKLIIHDAITHVSNTGGSDGIIDISITGGTGPYDFLWSNDATSEDLSDVITGEYKLIVSDLNSCVDSNTYRVKEPVSLQFEKQNITCFDADDGRISIDIIGGHQPYTISWSNGESSEVIENLAPGTYIVEVIDDYEVSEKDTIKITEPQELQIQYSYSDTICLGGQNGFINTNPVGGTSPYTYNWSNDSTTRNLSGLPAGNYSVKVTDKQGCVDSLELAIISALPFSDERICIVTIDLLSGDNLIVWEKTPDKGIAYYNIYREGTQIGTKPYDDLSIFRDSVADPEARPYLYYLSVVDTCGNESGLSPYHKPHFLQYVGSTGGVILEWDEYKIENETVDFDSYTIYRGSDSSALAPIVENIPIIINVYTDNDPQALEKRYYYRVAGELTTACYPSGNEKAGTGPYNHSLSNLDDNRIRETFVESILDREGVLVYPNPMSSRTTIQFQNPSSDKYRLAVMDVSGKIVYHQDNIYNDRLELSRGALSPGIYFIELKGNIIYRSKVVIE
jgi:uncharacterized protein (TIGR02145 family)